MKRPTAGQLRIAADWLRAYDEGSPERADMVCVADWLDAQADDGELRAAAREHGVPVAALRRKLRQVQP